MSNKVFANGREVSCKSDGNHCNGAMPDVCLTPPPPPAGPLPIPYPNFSDDGTTDDGTCDVQIGGKTVGQKNKSTFKNSKGNEAATRAQGMGVITHNISGATSHTAWSMNVKGENENITRHLDMTTHNHGSPPTNGAVTVKMGALERASPAEPECQELQEKNKTTRKALGQNDATSTVTTANFTPAGGGAPQTVWSCSRALDRIAAAGKAIAGYCKGLGFKEEKIDIQTSNGPRKAKKANDTNMCQKAKDRNFAYTNDINTMRPHTSHTESRIIESLMSQAPGGDMTGATLKMAINWQSKSKEGETMQQDVPCSSCHRVLCAAAECGLKIILCSDVSPKSCPEDLSGVP
ncbi:PAAR-like domain-containing protein [Caballeronia novacaledonica]|uniref:DUF4150 domain-containing protein n=1 Tax=Caballeronia novacaledonica TaxID=1544861 RepID=A0AA37IJM0_9BURK|nr:PAAR-like domain-containing protein [Caballeronia novacaledonica]GJH29934.1 DUF4150 domain-containing protein [Caballeronia novacaledonica]